MWRRPVDNWKNPIRRQDFLAIARLSISVSWQSIPVYVEYETSVPVPTIERPKVSTATEFLAKSIIAIDEHLGV